LRFDSADWSLLARSKWTFPMASRFAWVLALFVLTPLAAADSLYTGQVSVASQSEQDTATGLSTALTQVLATLSGDKTVLNRPGVAKAVAQPNRYVQQYHFAQGADNGQRLTLVAQFDHAAIDRLLADLGLARTDAGADAAATAAPVADTRPQTFRVWISGVNSALDYARAVGALGRNDLVRSVQAEAARNGGVQLRVEVNGPLQRLLESLASGPVRVLNAAPPVGGVDALLGVSP
jgi:hypothetical protein